MIDGWIEFKFGWRKNCKETTTFVKECEKNIECKKKGILNLAYKQEILFGKSKEPNKFREIYEKMEQVKVVKALEK